MNIRYNFKLICLVAFFANSLCCFASVLKGKKVLFVGNSITYYQGMAQTLQKMFDEHNLKIKVDQYTMPGAMLVNAAKDLYDQKADIYRRAERDEMPIAVHRILSENWDYVVLQEQNENLLLPEARRVSFEPSFLFLDSIIKSRKAKTVLFEAYARQSDHFPYHFCVEKDDVDVAGSFYKAINTDPYRRSMVLSDYYCSKDFKSSADELAEIKYEVNKMARITNASVLNVGDAFLNFSKKHPDTPLIEKVGGHPTKEGAYLIASLFYKYFTKRTLKDVRYSADINRKTAKAIREFVDSFK